MKYIQTDVGDRGGAASQRADCRLRLQHNLGALAPFIFLAFFILMHTGGQGRHGACLGSQDDAPLRDEYAVAPVLWQILATLVGMLVIVFAVLVPIMIVMPGVEVPLGWSYKPGTWIQRAPILALAMTRFVLSGYMAAFQLVHISWVWDPFW